MLVNAYRPHQARESLIAMMEEQIARLRGDIGAVREGVERARGVVEGWKGEVGGDGHIYQGPMPWFYPTYSVHAAVSNTQIYPCLTPASALPSPSPRTDLKCRPFIPIPHPSLRKVNHVFLIFSSLSHITKHEESWTQ